ncbi:MAG: metal ABC transporter permease [Cyclobacteriaceae bacterium]
MEGIFIIITGALVAISCGLLGCFLILRKMAMIGDAISHAVLPGIVIAFLITGDRNTLPMLIGAGTLGIIATFLIEFFHRKGELQTDASIGVTFTWLFALGVILISAFAGKVDIDQECVLYGEIGLIELDNWMLSDGTVMGPRVFYIMLIVTLLVITFIIIGFKGLFYTTFDPVYAATIGISTTLWHYLLMGFVSLTTVASFEAVGAILVVAMIVVPPATAYLLTDKLLSMLLLTVLFGIFTSLGGYYLAVWIDGSIAGAMATVAGFLFLLVYTYYRIRKYSDSKITEAPVIPQSTPLMSVENSSDS